MSELRPHLALATPPPPPPEVGRPTIRGSGARRRGDGSRGDQRARRSRLAPTASSTRRARDRGSPPPRGLTGPMAAGTPTHSSSRSNTSTLPHVWDPLPLLKAAVTPGPYTFLLLMTQVRTLGSRPTALCPWWVAAPFWASFLSGRLRLRSSPSAPHPAGAGQCSVLSCHSTCCGVVLTTLLQVSSGRFTMSQHP